MRIPVFRSSQNQFSIPPIDEEPSLPRVAYSRRTQSPIFFYAMASIGVIAVFHFLLSFLRVTPIGINWLCGLIGVIGAASHWILTYFSAKPKIFSFWLLWVQSAFMIAVSFYLSSEKCLQPNN